MRISLENKPRAKRKSFFSLFLVALFITLLIFTALILILHFSESKTENIEEKDKVSFEKNNEEVEIEEEINEKKEEAIEKIQEEIPELPKKDVEVLDGYAKEVDEYIENVLFFINFMNATFNLAFNDFENRNSFLLIADEQANLCIEYLGNKDIVPEEILGIIEGSERVAVDYCKSVKKYSSLTRSYWDETEAEEMVILLKELREHYEDVEVKAYVLKRICKDLEDAIF